MTTATAPHPLPAIRLDAVWDHDFTFEGEDLSGREVTFVLVAVGRPLRARRFEAGAGLTLVGGDQVAVRLTPALLSGLRAGDYVFQIQAAEGGLAETLLVGAVPVFTGLTAFLDPNAPPLWDGVGDEPPPPSLVIGPPGPTRVIRSGSIRGAPGSQGPPGPPGPTGTPGDGATDPGDLTLIFNNKLI